METIDWKAVHRECAIHLLANLAGGFGTSNDAQYRPKQVRICIEYADELVKQLKEREISE
mgnify:CR=1 FL=1